MIELPVPNQAEDLVRDAALFLDRDGVINHDPGDYIHCPEDWHLLEGIVEIMMAAQCRGYRLIVITNQGGIGLGLYSVEDLNRIHSKMHDALAFHGIRLDAVYACPHHPRSEPCLCRKPEPLMVQKAVHRFGLDPSKCLMIGDRDRDIEAAEGAGVHGYRIPCNADLRQVQGPWTEWLRRTLTIIFITLGFCYAPRQLVAQKLTAQVYLNPNCTQAHAVMDRLRDQQELWGDQVHWVAVFSDPMLPEKDCIKYLMDHNLAMALRRDPRQQFLSIYGIPQQPWLLITNNRSLTVYQGPLLEKPLAAPGKSVWENQLRKLVENPVQNNENANHGLKSSGGPSNGIPSKISKIQGSGCPVKLP